VARNQSCSVSRLNCYGVLQCVAVCCVVLQYVAVCCSVFGVHGSVFDLDSHILIVCCNV